MSGRIDRRRDNNGGDMVIDNVLTTQPELGPSIPDGGYGWVVFLITLFFQALIPSLLVSFGIFLAYARVQRDTIDNNNPKLWDNKLLHVPLFFTASWTFFDPTSRSVIAKSTWPRLVATAGTCLTCAGLLFLWMGMIRASQSSLFVLAGTVAGIGASIQTSQCEIILSQYFRLKLPILIHLGHATSALGFIVAPIIVGHHILSSTLMHVVLWYQAIILQGLILNLLLRKPAYLKSKHISKYNYISTNPDDEEDILSKNSRELQITRQYHDGTQIERHEIPITTENNAISQPSASSSTGAGSSEARERVKSEKVEHGISFEQEEEEVGEHEYEKVQQWETFEGDEEIKNEVPKNAETSKRTDPKHWEKFEDSSSSPQTISRSDNPSRNHTNLRLEMSFGNVDESAGMPATRSISGMPIPLFSDTPVNNNNTYSYDVLEDQTEGSQPAVFMPATTTSSVNPATRFSKTSLELLQQPTFYKSLITVITTKWSVFVFYGLYPSFLYQEVNDIKLRYLSNLVGTISLTTLLFAAAAYWINIEKKWRPKMLWFLSWVGALGYFMISDYFTEGLLLFGAVQIALSIAALQHVGTPLLGLTIKGEPTKEYTLISILSGLSFLLFVVLKASFKDCFRLMAMLNFFTGSLWLANYIYKRLSIR